MRGSRNYFDDDSLHYNETVITSMYQVGILIFALLVIVIVRKLSSYFGERAWFFGDVAIVGLCITGGIVAASAVHAAFFGTRAGASSVFFVFNALLTIVGLLHVSGITTETLNLVCEAFAVIATIVVVVVGTIGVLLIGSIAITNEIN